MNSFSLPVIPLAVAVSLCLVFTFIVFFLREHTRRFSNAERESLLPLAEEQPRLAGQPAPAPAPDNDDHQCGCRSGERAPCPDCLKRPVLS